MQPPQQHSWINLAQLKDQLIKKLGPDRSKQYFDHLNKFLSLKLSKLEFDKLCLRTIGKDGILLHNQLIRTILKNACTQSNKSLDSLYNQNGSVPVITQINGDIKRRTRPNGKTNNNNNYYSPSSSPEMGKHVQHHQENVEDLLGRKDGKELSGRFLLHAPLGIPFCPVSVGGACRAGNSSKSVGVSDSNGLLETIILRERMDRIVATQGLQGVSMGCANAVNNGLDTYLKGLIGSCCELSGVRSRPESMKPGSAHLSPEPEPKRAMSMLDFRVAMGLNPHRLGEDWPVLLETVCTQAFEE